MNSSKSGYKPNSGPNAVQRPPDRTMRCPKCAVMEEGFGQPRLGTPWVMEILRLKQVGDEPNKDIGRVYRCGNPYCDSLPVVKLWRIAEELGIEPAYAIRLVRAERGALTFSMDEFLSGQLTQMPIPASIAALVRPDRPVVKFGPPAGSQPSLVGYNPDAHSEPAVAPELGEYSTPEDHVLAASAEGQFDEIPPVEAAKQRAAAQEQLAGAAVSGSYLDLPPGEVPF